MREFNLVDNKCYHIVFSSDSMLAMWNYIRNVINEPRSYKVDEISNGRFVDSIGAYSLIETYKTEESVPETLFVDEIKNTAIAFKIWCDENVIWAGYEEDTNVSIFLISDNSDSLTNEQLYNEFIESLSQTNK